MRIKFLPQLIWIRTNKKLIERGWPYRNNALQFSWQNRLRKALSEWQYWWYNWEHNTHTQTGCLHFSCGIVINRWRDRIFMCRMLKLWILKVQATKPKRLKIKTHTHTRYCSFPWCANCWRCVSEIQSRTLLPTDAQNFTRTWKAVIKGWHISAPLPLCVGWPEIELQGFNRRITLYTAAQAPSGKSGRGNGCRLCPCICWNLNKWSDRQLRSRVMSGRAEEQ